MKMILDPNTWIHGLVSALIIGLSTAVYTHFQHPETQSGEILFLAIGGALLYLKQSPLPPQGK